MKRRLFQGISADLPSAEYGSEGKVDGALSPDFVIDYADRVSIA